MTWNWWIQQLWNLPYDLHDLCWIGATEIFKKVCGLVLCTIYTKGDGSRCIRSISVSTAATACNHSLRVSSIQHGVNFKVINHRCPGSSIKLYSFIHCSVVASCIMRDITESVKHVRHVRVGVKPADARDIKGR